MGVERNEDGGFQRRVTVRKPQAMQTIRIADADMKAAALDGILSR